jgi:hypothetical protein
METAIVALHGALVITCVFASVFFGRFWWQSRDRFFGMFAGAMVLLGANWVAVLIAEANDETSGLIYLIRLSAFLLIIAAIVDKNRR